MPSGFLLLCSCHASSHLCFRARPLTRLLLRKNIGVLRRHMRPQSGSVVKLSTHATLGFLEASLLTMGVHLTVMPLMLIHTFAGAPLAAVQAPRVFRRLLPRHLCHAFLRSVDYRAPMRAVMAYPSDASVYAPCDARSLCIFFAR